MPGRLPEINLLPEFRRDNHIQSFFFYLFVVLILLSFVVIGYFYFTTNSKLETLSQQSSELSEQRDLLAAQKAELESDKGSAYEQAVTFVQNYAVPTSTLIVELNHLLPENSYLSNYDYSSSGVNIQSHFETLDAVAQYTNLLTNSELISDTKVDSINTFTLKEEETEDVSTQFNTIPRYESDFSLTINKRKLKEESTNNE